MRENRLRLGHSTWAASLARRELAGVRFDDPVAELAQVRDVPLRLRVRPHVIVHRRNQQHGRLIREEARSEQIVCLTGRGTRKEIGGRRRNDDGVGVTGQSDVVERVPRIEKAGVHRPSRERLERDCSDELGCGTREDDVDVSACLFQKPREPCRLVARDPARDAEQDARPAERARVLTLPPGGGAGRP